MKKILSTLFAVILWVTSILPTVSAQYWWGGGWTVSTRASNLFKDVCPNGDYSPSFFDKDCGEKIDHTLSIDMSIADPYVCGGPIFGKVISTDIQNASVDLLVTNDQGTYRFRPSLDVQGMYRQDVDTVPDGTYSVVYNASDIHGNSDSYSFTADIKASCEEEETLFDELLDTWAENPTTEWQTVIEQILENNNSNGTASFIIPGSLPKTGRSPTATWPTVVETLDMTIDIPTIINTVIESQNNTFRLPTSLPKTGASL